MLQGGCKINATRFDLDKAIGSKYVKFVVNSFIGKGGGLQYLAIDTEKGIDPGVRGESDTVHDFLSNCFSVGISDAIHIKNIERGAEYWGMESVEGDLSANTSFTEMSVCVRFKFTSFLPDRYIFKQNLTYM